MKPVDPNDPNNSEEGGAPAWEREPRVRRALTAALEPSREGGRETEIALAQLRERVGNTLERRGNVRLRESVLKVVGGRRVGTGTGTLLGRSRALWTSLCLGATTALIAGLAISRRPRVEETVKNKGQTYVTHANQQAMIKFDGGTRVTLAPQTSLRVLHIGTHARTVSLERGEAYFEVTHTSGAPFIVKSGATMTQVLGTGFLIRYDPNHPHVHVAVTDGKVRINASTRAQSSVTLTAGQVGDITDSTTHVSTADDIVPGTEWAPGHVTFHDTPLSTVLQTISRWYGFHFRYADQTLGSRTVTMAISTRSSAEALAALEVVIDVNLMVVGDTVTLVPQSPQQHHGAVRIRTYDVWTPSREIGR